MELKTKFNVEDKVCAIVGTKIKEFEIEKISVSVSLESGIYVWYTPKGETELINETMCFPSREALIAQL